MPVESVVAVADTAAESAVDVLSPLQAPSAIKDAARRKEEFLMAGS
jgi:hypothetical protein